MITSVLAARRYATAVYAVVLCLSVCLSQAGIVDWANPAGFGMEPEAFL